MVKLKDWAAPNCEVAETIGVGPPGNREVDVVDKVTEPREGRQARGSPADLDAGKTLKGSWRPSVRAAGRSP
jgi:hypothetical protein